MSCSGVYVFTAAYGMSYGVIGWVLPSEVFPLSMRSKGVAVSTASNWINNCAPFVLRLSCNPYIAHLLTDGDSYNRAHNACDNGIVCVVRPQSQRELVEFADTWGALAALPLWCLHVHALRATSGRLI